MARQTLIHLHSANKDSYTNLTNLLKEGEIAVQHAADEQALYTLFQGAEGKSLAKFITADAVNTAIAAAVKVETDRAELAEGALAERVTEVEALLGIGEDVTGTTIASRVEALEGEMDDAEGRLDVIEGNAETEGSIAHAVAQLANGAVSANTQAINALEGRMDTAEGDIDALEGRMDAAEAAISANTQAIEKEVQDRIDAVSALSQTVASEVSTLNGLIDAVEGRLDVVEGEGEGSIKKALADANAYTDELANGAVSANTAAIALLNGTEDQVGSVAAAVKAEKDRAEAAESALDQRVSGNTSDINTLKSQVEALNSATHFRGVFEKLEDVANPAAGDVVVIKVEPAEGQTTPDKEYIYDVEKGWIELGDTTAEQQRLATAEGRLDAVEGRMDTAEGDIDALEGRMATAESGITANAQAIAQEVTDRENAVKEVADALAQEVIDRGNAVAAVDAKIGTPTTGTTATTVYGVIEENEKVTSAALNDLNTRVAANDAAISANTESIGVNTQGVADNKASIEALEEAFGKVSVTGSQTVKGDDSVVVTDNGEKGYVISVATIDCGTYDAE